MLYVASYDIPDTQRRMRVTNACKDFGRRVQYSVFECLLGDGLRERLEARLFREIDEREDSIRIYPLCVACEKNLTILGLGEAPEEQEVFIVWRRGDNLKRLGKGGRLPDGRKVLICN